MKAWIDCVCDRVDQITKQQPYYQELLARRNELDPRYQAILGSLSDEDAEIISEFIYVTTEMDYQRTQTAYAYGCRWK